jgi:hypothetical protein
MVIIGTTSTLFEAAQVREDLIPNCSHRGCAHACAHACLHADLCDTATVRAALQLAVLAPRCLFCIALVLIRRSCQWRVSVAAGRSSSAGRLGAAP